MQTAMRHAKPSPSLLDRPSVYSTTPYNTSIQRQFKYIGGSVMAVTKHNFRKPDRFSMWPCFSQVNNHAANTTGPFRKTTQIVGMCEWLIHWVVRPPFGRFSWVIQECRLSAISNYQILKRAQKDKYKQQQTRATREMREDACGTGLLWPKVAAGDSSAPQKYGQIDETTFLDLIQRIGK